RVLRDYTGDVSQGLAVVDLLPGMPAYFPLMQTLHSGQPRLPGRRSHPFDTDVEHAIQRIQTGRVVGTDFQLDMRLQRKGPTQLCGWTSQHREAPRLTVALQKQGDIVELKRRRATPFIQPAYRGMGQMHMTVVGQPA